MSTQIVPPPPVPPSGSAGKFPRFKLGTLVFLIFMVIIGGGILISRLTGSTNLTPNASTSNVLVGRVSPTRNTSFPTPTTDPTIKVFVTGEVENPGVYKMKPGDRVEDAINRAGGFTASADENGLDLAQRVKDEMKIVVSALPASTPTLQPGGITVPSLEKIVSPGAKSTKVTGKVNLNTASQPEIESLPGIGPVLAQRILDFRAKNGPFKILDDLRKVQGLNKSILDKIKDLVEF